MKKHETIIRFERREFPLKHFGLLLRSSSEGFDLGLAELRDARPDESAAESL